MAETDSASATHVTWADRLQARLAGPMRRRLAQRAEAAAPQSGDAAEARALLAGRFVFAHVRSDDAGSVWAPLAPTPGFEAVRQGFGWLDDLAALGTAPARGLARDWTREWLARFGNGRGPGWTLVLAARRLTRLLGHAGMLTAGPGGLKPAQMERAFARHQRFALRRLAALPGGAAGVETVCRLIRAGVALDGAGALVVGAQDALDRLCPALIDRTGGVPDRAPETLAAIFADLAFAAQALDGAGLPVRPEHRRALARAAPILRALRHADGHLARFQGGGAGDVARIDAALAAAGLRRTPPPLLPMGYARLARGRVTVIADCAAPATGPVAGRAAHASTLGFEVTAGRRPLIVGCGPGQGFGPDWAAAARATAAHSTLVVADASSARFAPGSGSAEYLVEGPGDVPVEFHPDRPAAHLAAAQNGYAAAHGLVHLRQLELSLDGGELRGEDMLTAVSETEKRRFVVARAASGRGGGRLHHGVDFALRFHLHPEVEAELDGALGEVRLMLANGEGWTFRHASACTIALDPGVYLENTRAEPAATRQIVLSGLAMHQTTSVRWTLTRDATAPAFLREVPRIADAVADDPRPEEEDPR